MASTFKFEHDFHGVSRAKFESHLNDEKLNAMLEEGLAYKERRLTKKVTNKDGSITWHFHVSATGDFPKAVSSILKTNQLSWDEISTFVPDEHCIRFQIVPHTKLLNMSGEGVWRLLESAKGCRRVIEGTITVGIPFVGKVVETFVLGELKKNYELEPGIQKAYLDSVK